MTRPMLDDLELQQVQTIELDGDQVWTEHSIPALEGDFFQGLGRRASQITLTGVLTGAEAADGLNNLRGKFRTAQPVAFVADIATATRLDQMLIEEMGVRELAGKPARFEYAFTLREYIPATPTQTIIPPPPPPPPPPPVETAVLEVEVIVEGQPDFDHSQTRVRVNGVDDEGNTVEQALNNREDNVWTADPFPPGRYRATATTSTPVMTGSSAEVDLRLGQRRRAIITLRPGQKIATAFMIHYWFDKAFVEPCMRHVLQQVAQYAGTHPDEKLVIVGHTDESGSATYNQSLSERRARGVYAYLTFDRDREAAVAEWNALRKARQSGTTLTVNDTWGTREYQYMLQDLGFYRGKMDGDHGSGTDQAVRDFQAANNLTVNGVVDDQTWPVLIRTYMAQDHLAIPEAQFMPNAKDGCDHGIVQWMGCGEKMTASSPGGSTPPPVSPPPSCPPPQQVTCPDPAWRPNRRTEMLFVIAESFPCDDIPQPVTLGIRTSESSPTGWCLGTNQGSTPTNPCCFLTRNPQEEDKWLVQPAASGTFVVNGRITFADGTPLANTTYVLIAPDGEFMNREHICGPSGTKGTPIPGVTDANGNLTDVCGNVGYPNHQKGAGVYTLEINLDPPLVARLAEEPPQTAKGTFICKRLDGSSDFLVIVGPPGAAAATLEFVEPDNVDNPVDSVSVGDTVRLRADLPDLDASVTEVVVEVSSKATASPGPGPTPGLRPSRWTGIMASPDLQTGNFVNFLIDGPDTFQEMHRAILTATDENHYIYLLGWWMCDDFPLVPPPPGVSPPPPLTIRDLFADRASRGVQIRAMLWDQLGTQNTDEVAHINALPKGAAILDNHTFSSFSLNVGSHHQKVLIVNGAEGLITFCGGIDLNLDRIHDMTTPTPFCGGSSGSSSSGGQGSPLHDVHSRIVGPAAWDLLNTFIRRWDAHPDHVAIDTDPSKGNLLGRLTPRPAPLAPGAISSGSTGGNCAVRIARTYNPITPLAPGTTAVRERSIRETLTLAIQNAQRFIYVEDQYLVNMEAAALLNTALSRINHLTILIAASQISDMPRRWASRLDFVRRLTLGPHGHKVQIFFLATPPNSSSAPPVFGPHTYVHAKTWIFDDELAVIGSANCNQRGWTHDSEVDAVIFEDTNPNGETFAQRLRMQLWAEHLNTTPATVRDGIASASLWATPPPGAHIRPYNPLADTDPLSDAFIPIGAIDPVGPP